jgi:Hemolysin activation/secretion protein
MPSFRRVTALMLCLAPVLAHAQLPEEPGRRLLEEQRQKLEQRRNQPTPEIPLPPPPAPAGAEGGPCFIITTIELQGVTLLSAERQEEILAGYRGKCLGQAAINELLSALTTAYVDAGYVTARAYLPPQRIDGGVLKVIVVEGEIESLDVEEGNWRDALGVWFAFPTSPGQPLRLADIEQGLDQLNRLPSNRAKARFVPGTTPGGTKVVIDNPVEERFRLTATTSNYGQKTTGRIQRGVGLEADNPLGIGDQWIINATSTRSSNAFAGTGSIPFGWWTLSGARSVSEYLQVLDGSTQLYGQSSTWNLTLDRVVHRDATTRSSVYGRIGYNRATRTINDIELTPQKLATAALGVSRTWRTAEGRQVQGDFALVRGLHAFGANLDAEGLPQDSAHAQFWKLAASGAWVEPLGFATWRTTGQGIWGKQSLYSPEQIQIGDVYTVRGYSEDQIVGDRGLYLRNEMIFDWPEILGGAWLNRQWELALQPFLLADAGYACLIASHSCEHAGAAGAGARFGNRRIALEATVARPLWASGTLEHDRFEGTINLTLQVLKW